MPSSDLIAGGAGAAATAAASPACAAQLHVVICCCGTRGDTQPFAALGLHLQRRRGHRVTLATEARMEAFVRGLGLGWARILGDVTGILLKPGSAEQFGENTFFSLPAVIKEYEQRLLREEGYGREEIWHSYEAALAGANVVVSGSFCALPSFCVAEKLGVPWLPMLLDPAALPLVRTTAFPMHFTAFLGLGLRCLNGWTFDVAHDTIWAEEAPRLNAWRVSGLGLRPIRDRGGLAGLIPRKHVPIMIACSTLFCGPRRQRPADYAENWEVGGFVFVPSAEETGVAVDARLASFLERAVVDNVPVFYLGFGSMPASPSVLVGLAVDVCARLKSRAVIVAGWSDIDTAAAVGNDALLIVKDAPHDWQVATI